MGTGIESLKNWRTENPEKVRAARKAWEAANPDKVREQNRRYREKHREQTRLYWRKYGRKRLGCKDATDELKHGVCPICSQERDLVWDHHHESGNFRGWICRACNVHLGWFENFSSNVSEYLSGPQGGTWVLH